MANSRTVNLILWGSSLACTAILAILYLVIWVGMYTHIYTSSHEIVDHINGYSTGENSAVTFTGDELTDTTRAFANAVDAYEGLGIMTIVTIPFGFVFLLISIVMITNKKRAAGWKRSFQILLRIVICLTALSTLMLIVFSSFLVSVRVWISRESTRTHVMVSEWCDDTTVSWDLTRDTSETSCDVPKSVYDDNDGPENWGNANDCCALQYGGQWTDIKYFCCMFKAPYDWGLKHGGATLSPFANIQQNLRDGTYASPTRLEYFLQPQFVNVDIWKQQPEGGYLLMWDIFTFSALWELIIFMTVMTVALVLVWIPSDTMFDRFKKPSPPDPFKQKDAVAVTLPGVEDTDDFSNEDFDEMWSIGLRHRDMRF